MGEISGEYDVVVVGGGIIGSCIAYQVAKRGKSVMLVEQLDLLHRRGSSHGESRIIRQSYPEPYYVKMMEEAFGLWEEAQTEIGYRVHTATKQLDIGSSDNKSLQALIRSCTELGVEVEVLDSQQVSARFSPFKIPANWIGVVTERGGVLRASKAVAMFHALALKNGAILRDNARVTEISHGWKLEDGSSNGVLVCTNRGSVLCRKCMVAAGAWTNRIVESVCGITLPIKPLHTTTAYWKAKEGMEDIFLAKNGFPTFVVYGEPYLYGTPSLEYPGLVKASLHGGYGCDPDKRALVPDTDAHMEKLAPWLAQSFDGCLNADQPVIAEACMYSVTPDEDFIVDFLPLPGLPKEMDSPVLVACGFSGHGFKMGPIVGRIMADLALQGHAPDVPIEYFSFKRFEKNPKGNPKEYQGQVTPCLSPDSL